MLTSVGKLIFSSAIALIISSGCSYDDDAESSSIVRASGIVLDMSKFDGCGLVIETEEHILEPTNIEAFDIELADSTAVSFSYSIAYEQASLCMMGTIVTLYELNKY